MRKPDAADYLMAPLGLMTFIAVLYGAATAAVLPDPGVCQNCFDIMLNRVESLEKCGKESCD